MATHILHRFQLQILWIRLMDNWTLFGDAWNSLGCLAIALSLPGVLVVGRGQFLLALAAGQSAASGAALAMYIVGLCGLCSAHGHSQHWIYVGAISVGTLGTIYAWRGKLERAAWLYALTSTVTILCIAESPFGLHDVLALQHSHALLAQGSEVFMSALLAIASLSLVITHHRHLRLLTLDRTHAAHCGSSATNQWEWFLSLWIGLTLSIGVSIAGLLTTFCWFLLPTMIASHLVRTTGMIFIAAPIISLCATIAGIIISTVCDVPPGQAIAGILVLAYPAAMLGAALQARPSRSTNETHPKHAGPTA